MYSHQLNNTQADLSISRAIRRAHYACAWRICTYIRISGGHVCNVCWNNNCEMLIGGVDKTHTHTTTPHIFHSSRPQHSTPEDNTHTQNRLIHTIQRASGQQSVSVNNVYYSHTISGFPIHTRVCKKNYTNTHTERNRNAQSR